MPRLIAVAVALIAAVSVTTLVIGPAWALGPTYVKVGMQYSQARYLLIRHGYTPVTHDDDDPGRCNVHGSICQTYPEAQTCQEVGPPACDFRFFGPGGYLKVSAGGQDADHMSVTGTGPL